MNQITGITSDAAQVSNITLDDGTKAVLSLYYVPGQLGWFFDLTYPALSFAAYGNRLVTSPNFLRRWRNILPFGMAAITSDNQEPLQQSDLSSGYCTLYLLNSSDVSSVETTFFTQ